MSDLVVTELDLCRADLTELEATIARGLKSFLDVGEALVAIRDRRLFLEVGHHTFDEYCQARWGFGKSYASRLIKATEVVAELPIGNRPTNEAQARELARVDDPDLRATVMARVMEATGGQPTASAIRTQVDATRVDAMAQAIIAFGCAFEDFVLLGARCTAEQAEEESRLFAIAEPILLNDASPEAEVARATAAAWKRADMALHGGMARWHGVLGEWPGA